VKVFSECIGERSGKALVRIESNRRADCRILGKSAPLCAVTGERRPTDVIFLGHFQPGAMTVVQASEAFGFAFTTAAERVEA